MIYAVISPLTEQKKDIVINSEQNQIVQWSVYIELEHSNKSTATTTNSNSGNNVFDHFSYYSKNNLLISLLTLDCVWEGWVWRASFLASVCFPPWCKHNKYNAAAVEVLQETHSRNHSSISELHLSTELELYSTDLHSRTPEMENWNWWLNKMLKLGNCEGQGGNQLNSHFDCLLSEITMNLRCLSDCFGINPHFSHKMRHFTLWTRVSSCYSVLHIAHNCGFYLRMQLCVFSDRAGGYNRSDSWSFIGIRMFWLLSDQEGRRHLHSPLHSSNGPARETLSQLELVVRCCLSVNQQKHFPNPWGCPPSGSACVSRCHQLLPHLITSYFSTAQT